MSPRSPRPAQPAKGAAGSVTPLPRPTPVAATQGTLALDLAPRLDPPRPRGRGSLTAADPAPSVVTPIDQAVRRELDGWSRRYAQAVVEIVNGDRPVSQLVRWTTPRVYRELTRRAQVVSRAGVHSAGQGRGRRPAVRPAVHNVHTSFVSPRVAEVAVTVRHGLRLRALAARFEHLDGRWVCMALEFG